MSSAAWLGLTSLGLWLVLACSVPRLPLRGRALFIGALVLAGVPLLGWLTLRWGPGPGVLGFAIGLLVLCRPPLRRRTDPEPVRHEANP
ncbi:DUF2484 family protein [Paracoccus sp. (in: a-proteobacteria)]|uniref:DUF2484 family protein n=1 Tax=Paracoccus sp. TaxID=267 RepID=UPI00272D65E4|nr:DUF2484 family protein [Paracoccus sp. (in: a-proteobacteria)]